MKRRLRFVPPKRVWARVLGILFFDEAAAYAEGADRCMTTFAAKARYYLTHAASDTAGDVGAVHHDISSEACGISKSGLWFL